jgi:hypothetical protein
MTGIERGIAEVIAALEDWLASTGATTAMMRLAWAVLTVLWLGHVAISVRPGRQPDLIDVFGRLVLAGGLLTSMGSLTRVIVMGFETFRGAGAAVLNGLIGQNWGQFVQGWMAPQMSSMFSMSGPWFAYPWAMGVLMGGIILGIILYALGAMVYLAILFFAHLTLLLAIFLAPLAVALLATPATQRWTARWLAVIVRTALVVFNVRLIHAAVLYLAVIVPVREVASGLQSGFSPGGSPNAGPAGLVMLILRLGWLLFLMLVGTGIGVYTMLRSERLIGQFVDGVAFGEHIFGGPQWAGRQIAGWYGGSGGYGVPGFAGSGGEMGWGGPLSSSAGAIGGSGLAGAASLSGAGTPGGGSQEATVMRPGGRFS